MKNKTLKNHWILGGFFVGLIVLALLTDFLLWRDFLISYFGNALILVIPISVVLWFVTVFRTLLLSPFLEDERVQKENGELDSKAEENPLRNNRFIDLASWVIIAGMILDYLYNPHIEFQRTLFPTIGAIFVKSIFDKLIKKRKLREQETVNFSVISFVVVLVVFMGMQIFAEHRSYGWEETSEVAYYQTQNFFEEELLPIGEYLFGEEATLSDRDRIEGGHSVLVPEYSRYKETWKMNDETKEEISIRIYYGREPWIVEQILKDYLNLRVDLTEYFVDDWSEDQNLAERWKVDEVWVGVGEPWLLIRDGADLMVVEVFPASIILR